MEYFEIGCCFKSYDELTEKLNKYCTETFAKFTTKDCRLIKDEFVESSEAKRRLIYTDLKLICVHGRTVRPKNPEPKRKRTEKNVQTGCPAYFRLKLIQSGVALQIVALNVKHNHPLQPPKEEETETTRRKTKKRRGSKGRAEKKLKEEIKSEDESGSGNEQELLETYVDADDSDELEVHFDLKGFCAPVFTPFNNDMSVNTEEIPKYAKYLNEKGIKAVLVNSTLGEVTLLSFEERKLITETWHEAIQTTKQHLMVQIGGGPLTNVLELVKHAEKLNVNSLLCLPELYFKPKDTDNLIEYLKIVSEAASKTPLLYYHNPAMTGVEINMKEFLEAASANITNFRGIYYSSSDLNGITDVLNERFGKYSIFFGVDQLLVGAFAMGFDSAIVSLVNLFPEYCLDILRTTNKSDLASAREIQHKLSEACLQISKQGNWISALKFFMRLITKINVGPPRPPLRSMTEDQISDTKILKAFI